MLKLIAFNLILITGIVIVLIILKKTVKTEKGIRLCFLISSLLTILCHYSSLAYHYFKDQSQLAFLSSNPNLILPIYPCNVVMWCCLIYGLLRNKKTKLASFLSDYIFWFGIVSCLVGMFVNVDFIRNPSLADYDVTKGIVAHAFMFFNVLLFPVFRKIRFDFLQNLKNIVISIFLMLVIGLYCNLVFSVIASEETAYQVNSMFLIHSPFDGFDALTYPLISLGALFLYALIFQLIDWKRHKKGDYWWNRKARRKEKTGES